MVAEPVTGVTALTRSDEKLGDDSAEDLGAALQFCHGNKLAAGLSDAHAAVAEHYRLGRSAVGCGAFQCSWNSRLSSMI